MNFEGSENIALGMLNICDTVSILFVWAVFLSTHCSQ
jgi:hypothetical protein